MVFNRTIAAAIALTAAFVMGLVSPAVSAQQGGRAGGPPQPPATPRAAAPIDITGQWVSVVTEDWRWRMVTPPRGDFASLPLNAEGQRVGNTWNPQADIDAGEQCRAYGAIGVMRLPTRLRLSWQDDTTLKVETDAGTQTRLFNFRPAGPASTATSVQMGAPSWQGYSVANWETVAEGSGVAPGGGGRGGGAPALSGSLKVVTTNLRPGYLRRNGAPYSGNAVFTEFIDRVAGVQNETWLVVTAVIEDPQYLNQPYTVTTHFKQEPAGGNWNPRPCEVTMPVGPEPAAGRGGRGAAPAPAAPAGGAAPAGRGGRGN